MRTLSMQRSLELIKEMGDKYWITQRWCPYSRRRIDQWNMNDIEVLREGQSGVIGIQCCGDSDFSSHVKKLLEGYTDQKGNFHGPNEYLPVWLRAGNPFFIWSWRKRTWKKEDGHRAASKRWELRKIEFVLENGVVTPKELP